MTRWSMPALLARAENLLITRRKRSVQPFRPTKLHFDRLEDRVVLDAVAPGSTWTDGRWQGWGYVGGTVSVSNNGSSWLEVNRNGSGAVTVAPGSPPPDFEDDYYYPYGPQISNSKSYWLTVNGYAGIGSGDVVWSGAADSLWIDATGDVSSLSIEGDLYVKAGETIENLSGHTVSATAGKSIGNVSASDYVGTLMAGTSIGKVSSANSISQITAGQSIGDVTAGGNITSIYAKENTGSISAGAWLGTVQAGLDIGGKVSAGLWIGGAYVPGTSSNDYWTWQYATYGGGISAGRDILGSVTAGKGILGVSAGRNIMSSVNAKNGDIWWIRAGGGGVSTTNSDSDYHDYDGYGYWEPYAPGRIVGPVNASRDIQAVSATGDIEGSVIGQGGFILGVNAGGDILGEVTAHTDIGRSQTRDEENEWRPFGYYWTNPFWYGYGSYLPKGTGVRAGGAVLGDIRAIQGDLTSLTARKGIDASVSAGQDVVNVSADDGNKGNIAAGRDILTVTAGGYRTDESYSDAAIIQSGKISILSGAVSAGRNVGSIYASGDLVGNINATHGIHEVRAGGNISSEISAGASVGSLDDTDPRLPHYNPYQYYYDNKYGSGIVKAGGNFTGSIKAGTDVSRVESQGTVSGTIDAKRDIGFVQGTVGVSAKITAGRDLGRVYSGGYGYSYNSSWWSWYPTWGELQNAPSGDFNGSISVVGDVYGVFSTGNISGPVTAGGGIADVSAKKSVTGDIYAGNSIGYLGDLISDKDKDIEYYDYDFHYYGNGVFAKEDIKSNITAECDITRIRADKDITGDILVHRDLRTSISAGHSVIGDVNAGRNIAAVIADLDDVVGDVAAEGSISQVIAGHDISGDVEAGTDIDTIISGLINQGGAISGDIKAAGKIQKIWALGEGESSQIPFEFSDPASSRFVWNWGSWSSQFTTDPSTGDSYISHWTSTYVPTRPFRPQLGVGGDIIGKVSAVGEIGEVRAFGQITNDITGKSIPSGVWAYGEISGNVTVRAGTAEVMSWDEISGNVSGVGANVRAYGDISGDVSGGSGTATVTSWEDARGNTDATGNVLVRALNNVGKDGDQEAAGDKKITSSTGKAEVWAGGDIAAVAKAKSYVGLYAKRSVDKTSGANSDEDEVWVQSETGDIAGGNYAGKLGVNLTSGRDIGEEGEQLYVTSQDGFVKIDASEEIHASNTSAKSNLWISARGGKLSGELSSSDGWAYAWAYTDFEGNISAKNTVSATALKNVKADITSLEDRAEWSSPRKTDGKLRVIDTFKLLRATVAQS